MSSDPTELQSMTLSIRKDITTTSESTDRSFYQVIIMLDIQSDVKKLRAGKSGGVSAVTSDFLFMVLIRCIPLLLCYLMLCYYTGHFHMIFLCIF